MSWGTIKDNLQKENSNDKYKSLTSGKGYFSTYGSASVKGTVILFGRTTNPTTTSYITPQIMSLKKRDREVSEPHITLIQISLIYKSCLLYYNKWFIAHASFLKGEAYFRLRISRIFAMFVKSKSNCPVKNKTKTKTKFTISWIIHPIWLDLTFNLSEDRGIDYITMNNILLPCKINNWIPC